MDISFEPHFQKLFASLEKLRDIAPDTKPEMLEVAQRLSYALVLRTQPYGVTLESKAIGEGAITRDVRKAYTVPRKVFMEAWNKNIGLAKQFYKASQQNDISAMRDILQKVNLNYQEISTFDGGAYHVKSRNRRGRVSMITNPRLITDPKSIDTYIQGIHKRVGTGKAGWVSASKSLNVTGKIPQWVLKNASTSNGSGGLKTTQDVIELTLQNNVPYINNICPPSEVRNAITYATSGVAIQIEKKLAARAKRV